MFAFAAAIITALAVIALVVVVILILLFSGSRNADNNRRDLDRKDLPIQPNVGYILVRERDEVGIHAIKVRAFCA